MFCYSEQGLYLQALMVFEVSEIGQIIRLDLQTKHCYRKHHLFSYNEHDQKQSTCSVHYAYIEGGKKNNKKFKQCKL